MDEYGALVVDKSRGVQISDDGTQRNNFNYRMVREEISLERVLHDRPDLARGLALTVRYPGNTAVQRSFTRQLSNGYVRGSNPSLSTLSQDWLGSSLSVERAAGVQLGGSNRRTDRVDVKIGRFVMRGWDSSVDRIGAEIGAPASVQQPIETRNLLNRVSADPDITRMEPSTRDRVDYLEDRDEPGAIGPAIGI